MTELFATGIQMGESPRWHDGRFWMCDWVAGEVLVFDPAGDREVVARVEGLPFSIDWLPDGRLIATTPRGIVAGPDLEPYGATGRPFNEIVVDAAGRAWVDMPGSMPWEEPKPGIVTVVLPDGSSRQVASRIVGVGRNSQRRSTPRTSRSPFGQTGGLRPNPSRRPRPPTGT